MTKLLFNLGRGLAAAAGAVLSVLWSYAMWMPEAGLSSLSGVGFAVALLMCLLAIIAVIAATRGHSAMIMVAFLASFLPVGAVLLRVDAWFRWIGVLDLLLLLAAALIWFASRRSSAAERSEWT